MRENNIEVKKVEATKEDVDLINEASIRLQSIDNEDFTNKDLIDLIDSLKNIRDSIDNDEMRDTISTLINISKEEGKVDPSDIDHLINNYNEIINENDDISRKLTKISEKLEEVKKKNIEKLEVIFHIKNPIEKIGKIKEYIENKYPNRNELKKKDKEVLALYMNFIDNLNDAINLDFINRKYAKIKNKRNKLLAIDESNILDKIKRANKILLKNKDLYFLSLTDIFYSLYTATKDTRLSIIFVNLLSHKVISMGLSRIDKYNDFDKLSYFSDLFINLNDVEAEKNNFKTDFINRITSYVNRFIVDSNLCNLEDEQLSVYDNVSKIFIDAMNKDN